MCAAPTELGLQLQVFPTYGVGMPMFVECTLENATEGSEYYDLLPCDPFDPPFPIELTFSQPDRSVVLPARTTSRREPVRGGFDLVPGQARTFVVDASELSPSLSPGLWEVQARWVMEHERPRSSPVVTTLSASSPEDLGALSRLRATIEFPGTWMGVLRAPPSSVRDRQWDRLSAVAQAEVLPYRLLCEAIHGPSELDALPLDMFDPAERGPWRSEVAVLRYELAWARGSADPGERAQVLARWPGLEHRIESIEAGEGTLSGLRQAHGPATRGDGADEESEP